MTVETAFGLAGVGFHENAVARVWLPGLPPGELERKTALWSGGKSAADSNGLSGRLAGYFEGRPVSFSDAVDYGSLSGFIVDVLEDLRKVKWGETVTYRELALRIGRPGAARAVGLAMSKNPVPLIVPCHRVIRSDGSLGGFTTPAGVELKRKMLRLEGAYLK